MQSSPTPSPLLTHRACNALLCRCTGRHSLAPYTLHTSTAHSTATTSHTADTRPKRSAQQRRRRLRRQIGECTDLRMRRSLPGEGGQRAATESKNITGRGSVCVLSCPVVVVVTRSQNTAKNQRAAEPMEEHRMLEPIEGGSSRDRQARSKASDVVHTLSSASMKCACWLSLALKCHQF